MPLELIKNYGYIRDMGNGVEKAYPTYMTSIKYKDGTSVNKNIDVTYLMRLIQLAGDDMPEEIKKSNYEAVDCTEVELLEKLRSSTSGNNKTKSKTKKQMDRVSRKGKGVEIAENGRGFVIGRDVRI